MRWNGGYKRVEFESIYITMWKTLLLGAIFLCCYPVIEGKPRQSGCPRTNKVRFCGKTCSTDGDCRGNRTCLCDGDCGMICVKNNLRCENLPKVKNGRSSFSNGSYFRSVVTYECKKGYRLRGSVERTCRATGKWDGAKARCRTLCQNPGHISFGNRRIEHIKGVKYIHFWCFDEDMFKMVGTPRIRCQENGQWSAPKPKCIHSPPLCDKPNIPDEAAVIYPWSMDREFKYGDRVLLKCKEGYFKSGLGVYQCKKGNRWSGGITCSPKNCGRPNDIPNGKIIGYVYSFKEKIRYECNEGYNLKGPSYRTCQANEKWGDKDPICEVVDCGPLQKPDHGDIIEQVAFTYGNRIVFDCTETGYEMKGSRVRTCLGDGTWSGSLTTCEAPCARPTIPVNGKIVGNIFSHGKSVNFYCDSGYKRVGARSIKCDDGKWDKPSPVCKGICSTPRDPQNGKLHQKVPPERFLDGDEAKFFCNSGYDLIGKKKLRCVGKVWDSSEPECKVQDCKPPTIPINARISNPSNKYHSGYKVTFKCNEGYNQEGMATQMCFLGSWTVLPFKCTGACNAVLGMHNKKIQDSSITASSQLSLNHVPSLARLDSVQGAWCSAPTDNLPYIEILLSEEKFLTLIKTQGSKKDLRWATKYEIQYQKDGQWIVYRKTDGTRTFDGNVGVTSLNAIALQPRIRTRSVRIYPKFPLSLDGDASLMNVSCLRLELYGCSAPVYGSWGA
ncbi:protein lev-9 [Pocillopora verrucosa]|uniref:protein lev-9 n=1 Tax=Pocillopora verrucosa TaxID=203993 RepID=UPI00333F9B3C